MFEHSLIDLEENKQRRRLSALPVAVGLHLAVLGTIALTQVWAVSPVGTSQRSISRTASSWCGNASINSSSSTS